jgi:hypothetical protein
LDGYNSHPGPRCYNKTGLGLGRQLEWPARSRHQRQQQHPRAGQRPLERASRRWGGAYSLALKDDGTVWAWGYNFDGQLGDGTNTDSNTPVQVSCLSNVQAIAGGSWHSLAVTSHSPDAAAPITTAAARAGGNTYTPGTWTNENVTLTLTADDGRNCSSGVKEIRYNATGAQNVAERTYDPQNPPVISAEGTTEVIYYATDNAGNTEQPHTLNVKLDATAPQPQPPLQSLLTNSVLDTATVPVKLTWSATDATSGVARYQLQQSINGGVYADVSLTTSLNAGTTYRFRIRAQDQVGNWSTWNAGPSFTVERRQENYQAVSYTGQWTLQALSSASGGYVKHAKTSDATAQFSFAGRNVAWVAPTGPGRGEAEVWINGNKVDTVDLYSSSVQPRKVVFTKGWAASKSRTLEIRVLGTKNAASSGERVDVDAFVVLR